MVLGALILVSLVALLVQSPQTRQPSQRPAPQAGPEAAKPKPSSGLARKRTAT
jgi:hypothetical protein